MADRFPRDTAVGLVATVVLAAVVQHRVIQAMGTMADRGDVVPAFLGGVLTAVIGVVQGYGKWVLDYSLALELDPGVMRRQVVRLVGVGAVAVLGALGHIGWAGADTATRGETVPGAFGTAVLLCSAALVQYGVWVLRCVRTRDRRRSDPSTAR